MKPASHVNVTLATAFKLLFKPLSLRTGSQSVNKQCSGLDLWFGVKSLKLHKNLRLHQRWIFVVEITLYITLYFRKKSRIAIHSLQRKVILLLTC